jgi:voltage-dependent calcium channel alpha-2/delta-3
VYDIVREANQKLIPVLKTRIFSYLTVEGGETLPSHLACNNRGSYRKLEDGENLISKMSNYYEYLSSSTFSKEQGLWTSPYIDSGGLGLTITYAVPAISKINNTLIGVAAVDATLEEIENILTSQQWGDVYSFLINKQGEAIFHPSLSGSSRQNVMEDPIAVPITKLEQDNYGNPKLFNQLVRDMVSGKEGSIRIENANRLLPKVNLIFMFIYLKKIHLFHIPKFGQFLSKFLLSKKQLKITE